MYFRFGNVEIKSSLDFGGLQIPQRLNFIDSCQTFEVGLLFTHLMVYVGVECQFQTFREKPRSTALPSWFRA